MKKQVWSYIISLVLISVLVVTSISLYCDNHKQLQRLAEYNYSQWMMLYEMTESVETIIQTQDFERMELLQRYVAQICSFVDRNIQPQAEFSFYTGYYYRMFNVMIEINQNHSYSEALEVGYQILTPMNTELHEICSSVVENNRASKDKIALVSEGEKEYKQIESELQEFNTKYKKLIDNFTGTYKHLW